MSCLQIYDYGVCIYIYTLPVFISSLGYVETTKGFNAKNQCDSRIYEYLLPTYALREKQTNIVLKEQPGAPTDIMVRMGDNHGDERYVTMTDPSILSNYRVNQKRLDKFSEAMSMFKGTHDFHNYTLSKVIGKRDTRRHIRNIKVREIVHAEARFKNALYLGQ